MAIAHIGLCSLSPFDPLSDPTSIGQCWKTWKKRFETYITALGVTSQAQKHVLLLYQAGEATHEIIDTLLDTGDSSDYQTALDKLDAYFTPKCNVDYEIFKFRTSVQQCDEPINQFATRLRKVSSTCALRDLDKEVKSVSIQNSNSKRLRRFALLETDLMLEKPLAKDRAFEVSDAQATGLEHALSSTHLAEDPETVKFVKPKSRRRFPTRSVTPPKQSSKDCRNCGKSWPHATGPCPAHGNTCKKCGKTNHFTIVCRSGSRSSSRNARHQPNKTQNQTVQIINPDSSDDSESDEYLFTLNLPAAATPKTKVKINNIYVQMVVDTGASVNIIDELTFQKLGQPLPLQKCKTRIFAYGASDKVPIIGKFEATLETKTKFTVAEG